MAGCPEVGFLCVSFFWDIQVLSDAWPVFEKFYNVKPFVWTFEKLRAIKPDLQKVKWESMDWISLVQYRDGWQGLVNVVMNLLIP
jgi:hypothetical protein